MKYLLIALLISTNAFSGDYKLASGDATYTVKHLIKRVEGTSREIKGKVSCPAESCEFLIAVPVKSFVSSDSNRDENMRNTIDASKFPLTAARGKMAKDLFLKNGENKVPVEIEFHGIKKNYEATFKRTSGTDMTADLTLKLTDHKIVRPSLFGVSIDDEVPVHFNLKWSEGI